MEVEQAEKLTPPPPAADVLEAKVAALDGPRASSTTPGKAGRCLEGPRAPEAAL